MSTNEPTPGPLEALGVFRNRADRTGVLAGAERMAFGMCLAAITRAKEVRP